MKKYTIGIIFSILVTLVLTSGIADLESQKKIAVEYFEKLTLGDIDASIELVTVPYTLDLKEILYTMEEIDAFHKNMLKRKGKRDIPEYTIEVTSEATELDRKIFPPYTAFRINIKKNNHLDIYITNTKNPKVIGFAD